MTRQPRIKSQTGIYHIMFRGINRQNIFEEERDYQKFMELLINTKQELELKIFAYCILPNHGHLLMQEKELGNISTAMHKILTTFAGWYNRKYLRVGTLFGNRFNSEPVEDDKYLFTLVRYIHQNPWKAGIANNSHEYKWSSYNEYTGKTENIITDTEYLLHFLSVNKKDAINIFVKFHQKTSKDNFDLIDTQKITDDQVRRKIIQLLNGKEPHTLSTMPQAERNIIIKALRENEGLSIRQIERATGVSRGIISRIK